MVDINFFERSPLQKNIDARLNNANLIMEWFSLRDSISLQTVNSLNSVITIRVSSEDVTYRFDILTYECSKSPKVGLWEDNYSLGENEFAKYVAPKIAEMLNEEGF